ncbi:MAG: hypothetical protein U0X75_05395 [Acidobacteriota bacterium]
MTPKVPLRRATGQLAPVSSLNELLVFPTPEQTAEPRSLWLSFLGDMSLLLPAFGALLGVLLLRGQAPFFGATLGTICPIILALRVHTAYAAYRERKQVAALVDWYQQYRGQQAERQRQESETSVMYIPVPPVRR